MSKWLENGSVPRDISREIRAKNYSIYWQSFRMVRCYVETKMMLMKRAKFVASKIS